MNATAYSCPFISILQGLTMQHKQQQFLHAHIYGLIAKLSMPVIVAHLLMFFYNIADTIFISLIDRNSESLMSGVGLVFPLFFLYIALGSGLFSGISSLVARSIGAKDENVLSRVVDSGLLVSILLAAATILLAVFFSGYILTMLAGSKISNEALGYAKSYFLFLAPGLSMMLIQMSLAGILQGEGSPQYFGMAMTLSTILNLVLDPVFIFTFRMGVAGAAIATSISMGASLLFVLVVFLRKKSSLVIHWNLFKAKLSIILEVLRIGIPHTASMMVLSISFMILNRLVGSISEIAMSSYVIYGRMNELILIHSYGIGNAAMTLVGQNFGAKNFNRVHETVQKCIISVIIISFIAALGLNLVAPFLFPLFSGVQQIVDLCIFQCRFVGFASVGIAVGIVIGSAFQGSGRALPGFVMTFVRMIFIVVPLSFFTVHFLGWGFENFIRLNAALNVLFMSVPVVWVLLYTSKLKRTNAEAQ